jgi:L-iditol 2-dehydrogenase
VVSAAAAGRVVEGDHDMKEARLYAVGDVRIGEAEPPMAGLGESLVRVTAVGLCGSDLHWFDAGGIGDAQLGRPVVLGHEFGGIAEGGALDGQRVAVDPALPCWICDRCREGNTKDGGLRDYVAWPDRLLHPVPPALSDVAVAMLEPLGVAIHTFDLGHVRLGASVAVVGCGPIGLLLLQLVRAAGCGPVVAVEPLPHRRTTAAEFGADVVMEPVADIVESLAAAGVPEGVDVAFEVAGTDAAVSVAMRVARPGARVILAGIPATDSTTFPASLARRKGLTFALVRRMKETYPRAIRLVKRGLVDLDSIVTNRFALADASQAFATAAARNGLKTVILP